MSTATAKDFHGMSASGDLGRDSTVVVTVYGPERIAAVRDAAHRNLGPRDEVIAALDRAVADGVNETDLPECWDEHDCRVMAGVLDDLRNGDDGSGSRCAAWLLTAPKKSRQCSWCGGTGESDW